MRDAVIVAAGAVGALAMSVGVSAAELQVPSKQYPTIQSAIDAAVNGDVVTVEPGEYAESVSLRGKSIALVSRVPLGATLRSPGDTRAIRCESGESSLTSIVGFRFAGNQGRGGGILVAGSSPRIRSCSFAGVRNATGGGLLVAGGNPRVEQCHFEACKADPASVGFQSGGAVRKTNGSMSIEDCTFVRNIGPSNADAIMNEAGEMALLRCDFGAHDSTTSVVYNANNGIMLIEDCVFHSDSTPAAAVCFSWGSRAIRRCVFRDLTALGSVVQSSGGHTLIEDCVFENLTSTTQPGAAVGRATTGATFSIGGSSFCGMDPQAIVAPFEDLGGNTFIATCTPPCPADLVDDGTVNAADLGVLLNFWGTDGSGFPGVDLDSDGIVGAADLSTLLSNWGECPE